MGRHGHPLQDAAPGGETGILISSFQGSPASTLQRYGSFEGQNMTGIMGTPDLPHLILPFPAAYLNQRKKKNDMGPESRIA
jgi:hypothetical protein